MNLSHMLKLLAGLLLAAACPALAAADPPPLEAYGDLPGVEDMAISPSGKGLAFIAKIEGKRMVVITADGGKTVRMMAPLDDMKVRSIAWAGEDLIVLTTSVTENLTVDFLADQRETFGAIILNAATGKSEMVFDNDSSIARAIFSYGNIRNVGGKWLGYYHGLDLARSPTREGYTLIGARMALFAVDLARNRASRVQKAKDGDFSQSWLVDAQGGVVAELEISRSSGKWFVRNASRSVLASGVDLEGDVGLIAIGHEGATIIYSIEDDEAGIIRWFEVAQGGGTPVEILKDIGVERPYIDPFSGRMIGYLQDRPTRKPVLFDPARQAIFNKVHKAFASFDLKIVDWTPDLGHFVVLISGNGDSGTYYQVDIAKLKADPVGYERPAIFARQVGPISTVDYKATDGLDLDGILTLPPGREAKNLPVIMLPHGGPASHDVESFDWWAQAFASRGYAVFQPNFRGSTNRDDAFRRASYGQWGRKMQSDISDGLAELAKRGIVDPKRACIMGGSYGGYAALAGVTLQQGIYRCAVAIAPVSDLRLRYNTYSRETGRDKMTMSNLREQMGDPSAFDAVSPRRFADRADAPVLLIHGKDDTVVPFEHSSKMADALKNAGKPHEMVVLREEDHWLSKAATRKQMLEEAMRFVQKHNPAD